MKNLQKMQLEALKSGLNYELDENKIFFYGFHTHQKIDAYLEQHPGGDTQTAHFRNGRIRNLYNDDTITDDDALNVFDAADNYTYFTVEDDLEQIKMDLASGEFVYDPNDIDDNERRIIERYTKIVERLEQMRDSNNYGILHGHIEEDPTDYEIFNQGDLGLLLDTRDDDRYIVGITYEVE